MFKHILYLLLIVQACSSFDLWKGFDKATTTPEYSWDGGQFVITWKIVNDVITLTMKGKTTGWISCGICKTTSMKECDFWTGWVVDSDNSVVLLDTWSTGDSRPRADSQSDLTLLNATQSGGETSITFSRPLKTGDGSQDYDIKNTLETVGWATYSKDGSGGRYSQHNKAGWIYINFVTGATATVDKIDPGMLLAIIVVVILLLWACIHVLKRLYKMYERYELKQELDPKGGTVTSVTSIDTNADTDIPLQEITVQKGQYNKNEAEVLHASPKEPVIGCFNAIQGFLSRRVPYSETPIGMVLLLVIYIGVNIGCLYYSKNKFSLKVADILAANMFFVTVPATRNSALVYLLGIPFDRAIRFHRWLGRFTVALAITHFALTLSDWKTSSEISNQVKDSANIYGLIALGILLLIFITSLNFLRRKTFEFFYFIHFTFIIFWVFAFLHHEKMRPWVGASVGVYAFDKFVRFIWGTLPQETSDFKIKGSGKDKILQMRVKKSRLASLLHLYDVGQYVFVNFPKVSLFEWHPFSVSSGPGETTLEINVKAIGGYTEKLLEHAGNSKSMKVRVEGPYGSLNVNYRRFPVVALVGGGIGITPLLGMLKDLAGTGKVDPKYFGGKSFVKKLHFIWIVPSMSVHQWFGDEIQEALTALGKTGTDAQVSIYVTREKSVDNNNNPTLRAGRPNIPEIFKNIMKDAQGQPTGVFVCGPQPMMEDVWDSVNKHRMEGETIHFHKETFEL